MRKYHPLSERIVDILVKKVNNNNRHYFRLLVGYYLSKVASMMRCNIDTKDRGVIPVNTYILNLMVSGAGKGHSTNIMEQEFVAPFKKHFLDHVFPSRAKDNINTLAYEKANNLCNSLQSILTLSEEHAVQLNKLEKQFDRLGELAFSFDSATVPAVKQMREKLLLAAAGSMNLELDEIGSNLGSSIDVLTAFLELYDIGLIKQKLIKNTTDAIRSEELPGNTPTNLMMFGTPAKLLDGDKTEELFKDFLETGYARRLLFGYTPNNDLAIHTSAKERYEQLVSSNLAQETASIQALFESFAQRKFNPVLGISKDNSIKLIDYQLKCEERATHFKAHQTVHKAEMIHRYYKALKLAGAYAFADNSKEITSDHLDYAISVVEDSGDCFHQIMQKKGAYERIALYLADHDGELTQHELIEALPFYKGSEAQRKDLMSLATSYGYKNNIIIKKRVQDDIEFFSGETLRETDLNKLTASCSQDIAVSYIPTNIPFNQLHKLTTAEGWHYTAHSFVGGHRKSENAIPGFNMIILDCDGDVTINMVKTLMSDFTYLISTTKRHTPEVNRFRLILPISHTVKLKPMEYAKFMQNVFDWLPFNVDAQAKDIARKWQSHNGEYFYNEGQLVDATLFIPETKKANEMRTKLSEEGIDNIEKWFKLNTSEGNRANHLYRYGMVLIDNGYDLVNIIESLIRFNSSLDQPLSEQQLQSSTLASITKKYNEKNI